MVLSRILSESPVGGDYSQDNDILLLHGLFAEPDCLPVLSACPELMRVQPCAGPFACAATTTAYSQGVTLIVSYQTLASHKPNKHRVSYGHRH